MAYTLAPTANRKFPGAIVPVSICPALRLCVILRIPWSYTTATTSEPFCCARHRTLPVCRESDGSSFWRVFEDCKSRLSIMETSVSLIKIAIVGPESTGKSTISEALARHYDTVCVPEYAREYCRNLDRQYTLQDELNIFYGQVAL